MGGGKKSEGVYRRGRGAVPKKKASKRSYLKLTVQSEPYHRNMFNCLKKRKLKSSSISIKVRGSKTEKTGKKKPRKIREFLKGRHCCRKMGKKINLQEKKIL